MSTVILCNRATDLVPALELVSGPLRCLALLQDEESAGIRAYLRERGGCEEVPRGALFGKRRDEFRRQYIEFMGTVNVANQSTFWWAMPFTTKNPLATSLCRDTFNVLLIADLVSENERPLVVITDSVHLAAQVREWGAREGVHVIDRVRPSRRGWRSVLRRISAAIFALAVVRTLRLWFRVRQYAPPPTDRPAVAVTTLIHAHSFAPDGGYRDAYFGSLVDFLAERETGAFIFAIILEQRGERLVPRIRTLKSSLPVVPVESCLGVGDLARCIGHALFRFLRPYQLAGPTEIGGRDVRCLLERAIREACRSGMLLTNLKLYYCGRTLAQRVPLSRCLYPYENRAFEKMLVTGVREASPTTRLIGYNHASITLSHTNFILGSQEAQVIPLPDRILTLGPVIRDWLEAEGQYPPGIFQPACALRQSRPTVRPPRSRRRPIRDVLVPLATSLDEYVSTLLFLDAGFRNASEYRIRIRPHPTIRLEDALRVAPVVRQDFFTEDRASLAESLEQADVVLYASSTVGLEAVALGIPAVYLDLEDFLDTDPMIGWTEFKWRVQVPGDLPETLRTIDAIPDDRFRELQIRAQEYAARYLQPVNPRALQVFLET